MSQLTGEAVTDDDGGRPGTWMTPQEYGASRAALWTGAVVLVTDTDGRVLVQSVDYRPDRLLPGGAVDAGEAPAAAAAREVREELGIDGSYPHGLAVDWIPADIPGFPPEMRFPGEILYVYDGGTWTADRIDAIRLPAQEITGIQFAEPADLPALMDPGDARRALSALRARINGGGPALLEDGRPTVPTALDRLGVLRTRRTPSTAPGTPARCPRRYPYGSPVPGCSPPTAGSCCWSPAPPAPRTSRPRRQAPSRSATAAPTGPPIPVRRTVSPARPRPRTRSTRACWPRLSRSANSPTGDRPATPNSPRSTRPAPASACRPLSAPRSPNSPRRACAGDRAAPCAVSGAP